MSKNNENTGKVKSQPSFSRKVVIISVALALVVIAFIFFKIIYIGSPLGLSTSSSDRVSTDGSSVFMRYEGPVLPIIIDSENENQDVHIDRKLVLDFFGVNGTNPSVSTAFLRDIYQLNNIEEEQIKVIYPFVSSIDDLYYSYPRIVKDGKELEATLHYGSYTGTFVSAESDNDLSQTVNLKNIESWEEYQTIFNGERPLDLGYSLPDDLDNIPVTTYSFTNSYYPETAKEQSPTLVAGIEIDRDKSAVLTLGFDGFAKLDDGNEEYYQYSIPKEDQHSFTDDKHYLIIIGEDSPALSIETQSIGGWDGYEKRRSSLRNNLEDAGADIKREEMSLDDALDLTLPILYKEYKENQVSREGDFSYWKLEKHKISSYILSYEEFKELYTRELFEAGVLSESPMMRYEKGALELLDVTNVQRVIFAEFEISLAPTKITELEINSYKQGSYDFYGDNYDRKIYGYDLLTTIGLATPLDKYEVEIIDYNKADIVKENFGFDLEKDIRMVTLSEDTSHYFIEISQKN